MLSEKRKIELKERKNGYLNGRKRMNLNDGQNGIRRPPFLGAGKDRAILPIPPGQRADPGPVCGNLRCPCKSVFIGLINNKTETL